jgi:hypothetical protein
LHNGEGRRGKGGKLSGPSLVKPKREVWSGKKSGEPNNKSKGESRKKEAHERIITPKDYPPLFGAGKRAKP